MSSTIAAVDHLPGALASVEFGRFRVVPHRREFLADGRPIKLGGRDFDVLMALIEASGTVISKDELMSRVWTGRIVEENSLQGAISVLRKAFGADRDLIAGERCGQQRPRFHAAAFEGGLDVLGSFACAPRRQRPAQLQQRSVQQLDGDRNGFARQHRYSTRQLRLDVFGRQGEARKPTAVNCVGQVDDQGEQALL